MLDRMSPLQIQKQLGDRGEAAAVRGTGAELFQRLLMGGGGVAFVDLEAVARVAFRELHHEPVTPYLCDDAGGGNAVAEAVAFH